MDYLRYVDSDSFMHRLDPRTKFAFFLVMAVITSFMRTGESLTFLLAVFATVWVSCGIGAYLIALVKKIKVLLIFVSAVWIVMGALEANGGFVIWRGFLGPVQISLELFDIYKCYTISLRIFLMVASFYTVILTTNFSDIILGLRKWRIPYSVAFGIGMVFQIIPMIISEFRSVMDAQSSRGLEVEAVGMWRKLMNTLTASVPLLFRVLGKGHSVSLAMFYYKLNFKKARTSYKNIKASYMDAAFGAATALCGASALAINLLWGTPIR